MRSCNLQSANLHLHRPNLFLRTINRLLVLRDEGADRVTPEFRLCSLGWRRNDGKRPLALLKRRTEAQASSLACSSIGRRIASEDACAPVSSFSNLNRPPGACRFTTNSPNCRHSAIVRPTRRGSCHTDPFRDDRFAAEVAGRIQRPGR